MVYRLAQFLLRIYFLLWHRVSVIGLDKLKERLEDLPAAILAANHASYLDPPLVGMIFPRRLRFVAWDKLFTVPILAQLIRALGAVPVSAENKNSSAGLLRQVMGFIEDGHDVLIFPEGARTLDGNLIPFEGGTALVALKTGAPIIPVWLDGTWEAYPPHLKFPRPRKIRVVFGEPIYPADIPGELSEKQKRSFILDKLLKSLEEMRDSLRTR